MSWLVFLTAVALMAGGFQHRDQHEDKTVGTLIMCLGFGVLLLGLWFLGSGGGCVDGRFSTCY